MRGVTLPLALATFAVLGTVSCVSIGSRDSPATQHYVLSPVVEAPPGETASPTAKLVIGVGPVTVPAYLDRPQMVVRRAPDLIEVLELEQWGEPLRDGVTRVLAINLAHLLPHSVVVVFPWRSTEKVGCQVVVDVVQMDGPARGILALDARWRVLDRSGSEVAASISRLRETAGAGGTAAAVSRALGILSRDIAGALNATERGKP